MPPTTRISVPTNTKWRNENNDAPLLIPAAVSNYSPQSPRFRFRTLPSSYPLFSSSRVVTPSCPHTSCTTRLHNSTWPMLKYIDLAGAMHGANKRCYHPVIIRRRPDFVPFPPFCLISMSPGEPQCAVATVVLSMLLRMLVSASKGDSFASERRTDVSDENLELLAPCPYPIVPGSGKWHLSCLPWLDERGLLPAGKQFIAWLYLVSMYLPIYPFLFLSFVICWKLPRYTVGS